MEDLNKHLLKNWPFVWTYWENGAVGNELKYSIRSTAKWHPEAKIVIIGDRPDWYEGDFIAKPRIAPTDFHAFQDCYSKLRLASEDLQQFVWMMDDIYWTRPFDVAKAIIPKYVRYVTQQKFEGWKPKNAWGKTRGRAYTWLLANNYPTYDFAAHLPQPIRASTFAEMEKRLNLKTYYRNWECCYFNMFYTDIAKDYGKRYNRVTKPQKPGYTPKHGILNHTHRCYKGGVVDFLRRTFPEKCKYEKS